jgi:hypothetical protein
LALVEEGDKTIAFAAEPPCVHRNAASMPRAAKEHGIDVADRGRLRPEIWEQYHAAHPA